MSRKQDFEIFINKYAPHMFDRNIKQYDTHDDWTTVNNTDYHYVWTVVDGDNGNCYLSPGKHLVNRLFYVICNKPWTTFEETRDYKY